MKFKVGDKVRVVKRSAMNHEFGSILTITKVFENFSSSQWFPYRASDDDGHVIGYNEDELELIERRNDMYCNNTRKEAELKELTLELEAI